MRGRAVRWDGVHTIHRFAGQRYNPCQQPLMHITAQKSPVQSIVGVFPLHAQGSRWQPASAWRDEITNIGRTVREVVGVYPFLSHVPNAPTSPLT